MIDRASIYKSSTVQCSVYTCVLVLPLDGMFMLNIEDRGRALVPEDALAPAGEPGSERTRGEERERRKNGEKRPERDERREGGEDRGWRLKVLFTCSVLLRSV